MKQQLLNLLFVLLSPIAFCQTVTPIFSEVSNSSGLAIHDNTLYIATSYSGSVYTIDLLEAEAEPELYISELGNIASLCFKDDYLYFARRSNNPADNKILRINTGIEGATVEEVVSITSPNGLTVDDNTLYISSQKKIFTVDLSQPDFTAVEIINSLDTTFGSIGVEVINQELFVSDQDKLVKYNLAEANPAKVLVVDNLPNLTGLSKAENNSFIYATSYGPDAVFRINITDGQTTNIASTDMATNWDIVFDDSILYVSNSEGGGVVKIEGVSLAAESFERQLTKVYPVPAADYLYIQNGNAVSLTDITGKQFEISMTDSGLDVSALQSGTYILILKVNDIFVPKRFIKK